MMMNNTTTMMMMEVEEEEEEEEEEEQEIEHVFVAHEIDLDYEFDAARFFDFTRPETPAEAQQAELWFQNAPSYPPSPFVAKLVVREGFLLDHGSDSPNSRFVECTSIDEKSSVASGMEFSQMVFDDNGSAFGGILQSDAMSTLLQVPTGSALSKAGRDNVGGRDQTPYHLLTGLTFSSKTTNDILNSKGKSAVLKTSTLMKPTVSQLAKQNQPPQNVGSRFQKLLAQNERNLSSSSGVESQAAKRQKLEGGVLCKVTDVKQQTNFVHKAPRRAVTVEQSPASSKLKLTIPREPDLKTAHRAQRIRPQNAAAAEHVTVAAPGFKARPLNRKILDAPSLPIPKRSTPRLPEFQEFHLKTSERAIQHTFATSSSSLHCNDSDKGLDKHTAVTTLENRIRDLRRPSAMATPKFDGMGFTHNFKARPLNKKILSSKGDIGFFQNSKQETTLPMEFNLYTEKGVQYNPPIELFSKLSLTSEVQPNNGSHLKLPQHSGMCRKKKPFMFGAKQIHSGNGGGCISEAGTLSSARRSLGIR